MIIMKAVHFIVTLLLLLFTFAHHTHANDAPRSIDDIQEYAYISTPQFEAMARAALNQQPPRFEFTSFRSKYSQTRQYDPMGTETIDRMHKLAFTLDTTKNADEYKAALNEYQNLIIQHMAHLGVVMEALALSKTHPRYGDPKLFKWLKHGLIRDVMISGDGYTLKGAYDVITIAEETILFNYLGMRQVDTQPNREFNKYYNMHSTALLKDGQKYTIFVDTTIPMTFLNAVEEMQEGFSIDLRY
jgi:hypothetical protein